MTLWSRLTGLVKRKETPSLDDHPLARVRWVPASENPLGVDLLDCRGFAQSMTAVTKDPAVAETYVRLRASRGEEHRGLSPAGAKTIECKLRYPHKGKPPDGPIFKAKVMEDKWDIYLYDDHLYFARSWTGALEYRATISFHGEEASVVAVEAPGETAGIDPLYPVTAVDYLIRSHLYRLPAVHPLPNNVGRDPRQLALFCFSQYGRYGLIGAFGDTTRLPALALEESGQD